MTQRDEREKLADRIDVGLASDSDGFGHFAPPLRTNEWRLIAAALRISAPADGEALEEIQRLQDAKRRALSIADERAKENVALRAAILMARQWVNRAYERCAGDDLSAQLLERDLAQIDAALSNAPPASEGVREKALRGEIWCLREVVRGVRIMANAGAFSPFEGEAWLKRVRNIDLYSDPAPPSPEPADTPDEGPDPLGYAKGERA